MNTYRETFGHSPSVENFGQWYVAALKAHKWDIGDIWKGYRNVGIVMIVAGVVMLANSDSAPWVIVGFGCLQVYFGVVKKKTIKRIEKKIEMARDYLEVNVDEVPDYNSQDVTGWFP